MSVKQHAASSTALLPLGVTHARRASAVDATQAPVQETRLLSWPLPERDAVEPARPAAPEARGPIVLDEAEFQASLRSIIARDFYPQVWVHGDATLRDERADTLSLNQFLDNHISEDNYAFVEIVDHEKQARPPRPRNPNAPAMLTDAPQALLLLKDAIAGSAKETNPAATRFKQPPPRVARRSKRKASSDFDGYALVSAPAVSQRRALSVASSRRTMASGRARRRVLSEHAQALVKRLRPDAGPR